MTSARLHRLISIVASLLFVSHAPEGAMSNDRFVVCAKLACIYTQVARRRARGPLQMATLVLRQCLTTPVDPW